MEPLDWQKAGFEAKLSAREARLKRQEAIRTALANSRLPEYPTEEANPTRSARAFIKEHEATHGVMGLDGAGIPTDAAEDFQHAFSFEWPPKTAGESKATDAQLGVAMANILTAPERGLDMVNLPAHYARYVIEPIRFICSNKLDFFQGNIVKYVVRHDAKNGIEDIDKVIRYAQMYKRFLMKDPDWWKAGKPGDLTNG